MTRFFMFPLLLGTSCCAYAYIDPGSGSFMIQMFIASLLGAGLTMKMYIQTIKTKIKKLLGQGKGTIENHEKKPTVSEKQ